MTRVIRIPRTASTPIIASGNLYQRPLLSGQLTSYENNDDGWNLANDVYDYIRPTNPATVSQLDTDHATPFLKLVDNNAEGNKDRFTDDVSGGQVYTNDLVICHLTGLMYYRVLLTSDTLANQIIAATASTQGGFSDWRITNLKELENILDAEESGRGNYAPFNIAASSANNMHTSTTTPGLSISNFQYNPGSSGRILNNLKSVSIKAMMVRTFYT